jgi:hypothetical protein
VTTRPWGSYGSRIWLEEGKPFAIMPTDDNIVSVCMTCGALVPTVQEAQDLHLTWHEHEDQQL